MTNRDPQTGIYRDRTMLHVTGSNLNQSSDLPNMRTYQTAATALEQAVDRAQGSQHLLVFGYGTNSGSDYAREMFQQQPPIPVALLEAGSNVIQQAGPSLTVEANGNVVRR